MRSRGPERRETHTLCGLLVILGRRDPRFPNNRTAFGLLSITTTAHMPRHRAIAGCASIVGVTQWLRPEIVLYPRTEGEGRRGMVAHNEGSSI